MPREQPRRSDSPGLYKPVLLRPEDVHADPIVSLVKLYRVFKMQTCQLLILATLIGGALAAPTEKTTRACAYTCGSHCYSSSAVSAAQNAGYKLQSSGSEAGNYPHEYHDYEGFDFPVSGTYYEFPILSSGKVYSGGSPGADRVVFTGDDELAGLITHSGASGNNFKQCT